VHLLGYFPDSEPRKARTKDDNGRVRDGHGEGDRLGAAIALLETTLGAEVVDTTGRTGRPYENFSQGERAGNPYENFSQGSKGTARDKVGKVVGMSGRCVVCGEASAGLLPFYGLGHACEDCAARYAPEATAWATWNAGQVVRPS